MREFIYPEMMMHVPLCTHKEPESLLIISANAEPFLRESAKYAEVKSKAIDTKIDALRDEADKSYDVVACEMELDAAVIAHISRILNEEGLVVMKHPSLENAVENKRIMQILANYFKIIMPYNLGNGETALLASKAYHPTADVILHRVDMLDGVNYYNCDIHPAAFAMPNYIRKEYLGIIRN